MCLTVWSPLATVHGGRHVDAEVRRLLYPLVLDLNSEQVSELKPIQALLDAPRWRPKAGAVAGGGVLGRGFLRGTAPSAVGTPVAQHHGEVVGPVVRQ